MIVRFRGLAARLLRSLLPGARARHRAPELPPGGPALRSAAPGAESAELSAMVAPRSSQAPPARAPRTGSTCEWRATRRSPRHHLYESRSIAGPANVARDVPDRGHGCGHDRVVHQPRAASRGRSEDPLLLRRVTTARGRAVREPARRSGPRPPDEGVDPGDCDTHGVRASARMPIATMPVSVGSSSQSCWPAAAPVGQTCGRLCHVLPRVVLLSRRPAAPW